MMAGLFFIPLALMSTGCLQTGEVTDPGTTALVFRHGKLSGDERVFPNLLCECERRHPQA